MAERRWLQAGGVAGILFVVLYFVYIPTAVGEPALDATAGAWLARYQAISNRAGIDSLLFGLYATFFAFFVAGLYVKLRSTGERARVLSVVFLLGAILTVGMQLVAGGAGAAAAIRVGPGLDVVEAGTLADLATGFFVVSWVPLAVMCLAAGLAAILAHALPSWLGWTALVVSVGFFVGEAAPLSPIWYAPNFLYFAWILAVSVVLLRSGRVQAPA